MPPALSDYDSDTDSDTDTHFDLEAGNPTGGREGKDSSTAKAVTLLECPQTAQREPESAQQQTNSRPEQTNVLGTARKCQKSQDQVDATALTKRKHNILLGLSLDNIIEPNDRVTMDTPPTSSAPTSSYRTRSQNKAHTSELLYDQKYHPMDDYLRPTQAARRRAIHEEQVSDDDSEVTGFEGGSHSESDSEIESQPSKNKRRKVSHPNAQATRRSTRQVNREVLYDTSVHPQDDVLDQMDVDSPGDESGNEEASEVSQGEHDGLEGSEVSITSSDSSSEVSTSPSERVPLGEISVNPWVESAYPTTGLSTRSRLPQTPPFRIFEEPLPQQLAREAAAPEPIEYDDHNNENDYEHLDTEDASGSLSGITVRTMAEFNALSDPLLEASPDHDHLPTLDGNHDQTDYAHRMRPIDGTIPRGVPEYDRDSVLGSRFLLQSFDSDSVLGSSPSGRRLR